MVFLLEVERGSLTHDPPMMSTSWSICGWNRQASPEFSSQALVRSSVVKVELTDGSTARVRRPTLVGAALGKVAAVTQIVAQTSAERAKHVRDVDSLARCSARQIANRRTPHP